MSDYRRERLCACLAGAFSLFGCSVQVPTTVEIAGAPNAEIALQRSMAHVGNEMSELGRAKLSRGSGRVVVPAELEKVVAFDYEGPIEGAVEKLAREVGYEVAVDAPFNNEPVSIGIKSGPQRVYDIFQAIGGAAGNRATVQVDAQHHRVQVIYHV